MDKLNTALCIYMIGHLWWITHRLGRIEGKVFNNKNRGGNHE